MLDTVAVSNEISTKQNQGCFSSVVHLTDLHTLNF